MIHPVPSLKTGARLTLRVVLNLARQKLGSDFIIVISIFNVYFHLPKGIRRTTTADFLIYISDRGPVVILQL